jgi:hypothetical protein
MERQFYVGALRDRHGLDVLLPWLEDVAPASTEAPRA